MNHDQLMFLIAVTIGLIVGAGIVLLIGYFVGDDDE